MGTRVEIQLALGQLSCVDCLESRVVTVRTMEMYDVRNRKVLVVVGAPMTWRVDKTASIAFDVGDGLVSSVACVFVLFYAACLGFGIHRYRPTCTCPKTRSQGEMQETQARTRTTAIRLMHSMRSSLRPYTTTFRNTASPTPDPTKALAVRSFPSTATARSSQSYRMAEGMVKMIRRNILERAYACVLLRGFSRRQCALPCSHLSHRLDSAHMRQACFKCSIK